MKLLDRKIRVRLHTSAAVRYKTRILNADGTVFSERPWKNNLILDAGLDSVAAQSWVGQFEFCAVGTATTPVKRDSGSTTFSRSLDQVTASAGFFEAADVGRLLKFDTGEEMYVTVFTSPLLVTVATSGTIAAAQGTVWYVNQTGLTTESQRTGTTSGGPSMNKSTFAGATWTHQRQFLFPAVGANVTYHEIGWSKSGGAGANLFGRDLIPGGGDSLLTGQQYQVIVTLILTLSPAVPTAAPNVGTGGFNTVGNIIFGFIGNSAFSTIEQAAIFGIEPAQDGFGTGCMACNAAFSLPAAPINAGGGLPGGSHIAVGRSGYSAGSFTRTLSGTFGVVDAIYNITGFVWGSRISGSMNQAAVMVLFTTPQAKDGLHTLTPVLTLTWGRTLTN